LHIAAPYGIGRTTAVVSVILILVVAAGGLYVYAGSSVAPDKVTLLLDFTPTYNHFPYYYGLDHGIYKSNGIDLTIQPGTGASASISALAAGKVDFALADVPGLVLAELSSNITNVRVVAAVYQKTFYSIYYNKATISSLADLEGQAGGANSPSTSVQTDMFYVLAKLNGINSSSLKLSYGSQSVITPLFVSGKLQYILKPLDSYGDVQAAASANGIQVGLFPFEAYGIDAYGSALLTTTQVISKDPSLVQRMVLATMQSVVAASKDPAGAAASLVKYEPQLNETSAIEGINLLLSCCMVGANTTSNPLTYGWLSPARMQSTLNLVLEGTGSQSSLNVSSLYTDQFVRAP
jgi:NitT/TauT family transport system substrate-binding protein